MRSIFDVGAHHGQSAIEYSMLFSDARIDSFEPVTETFLELQRRTARNTRINCHNFALGSRNETSSMITTSGHSSMFKISEGGNQSITIKTVVDFCAENEIERINFLKSDTEGFDLEVVRGADSMIGNRDIDFIQVEAGMNPENDLHVYFEHFTAYLHSHGYRIFGIYDQAHEWIVNSPKLRRSNIVFASPTLL